MAEEARVTSSRIRECAYYTSSSQRWNRNGSIGQWAKRQNAQTANRECVAWGSQAKRGKKVEWRAGSGTWRDFLSTRVSSKGACRISWEWEAAVKEF